MIVNDPVPAVVVSTPGLDARQIAAITAVVAALTAQAPAAVTAPDESSGGWNDRAQAVRTPLRPALGAWRSFAG